MTARTILLATDLSPRCDRALDRAVSLALEWQAKLVALHALQSNIQDSDLPPWRRSGDPVQSARQRLGRDLGKTSAAGVEIVVEKGEPETLIQQMVARLGCELVVTGMARDEYLGRVQLGGTIKVLLRKTDVPILVVKSRTHTPYHDIVVASDFSEGSRAALEATLRLFPETRVTLFHAYDVLYENFMDDKMKAREQAGQHAEVEARVFLATTPGTANRAIEVLCAYGDPGMLLNDLIDARGVDLVVLGTEGRSGLAGMLLGSVAQRLQAALPMDALLVRRHKP